MKVMRLYISTRTHKTEIKQMGFLLYAARKLQLKQQINNLNFRAMTLSQEQQTITKQIADFQQAMNNTKNYINIFGQNLQNAAMFQAITDATGQTVTTAEQAMQLVYSSDAGTADKAKNAMALQQTNTGVAAATNVVNSVFDAVNKAQLAQLQAKDSEISLEKESIESQTMLLQEEYKSVKQAEQDAAKDTAPTFGLA